MTLAPVIFVELPPPRTTAYRCRCRRRPPTRRGTQAAHQNQIGPSCVLLLCALKRTLYDRTSPCALLRSPNPGLTCPRTCPLRGGADLQIAGAPYTPAHGLKRNPMPARQAGWNRYQECWAARRATTAENPGSSRDRGADPRPRREASRPRPHRADGGVRGDPVRRPQEHGFGPGARPASTLRIAFRLTASGAAATEWSAAATPQSA